METLRSKKTWEVKKTKWMKKRARMTLWKTTERAPKTNLSSTQRSRRARVRSAAPRCKTRIQSARQSLKQAPLFWRALRFRAKSMGMPKMSKCKRVALMLMITITPR